MLEAYRVGVSLLMDTGITSQLSSIIAQFEKLDAVVRRVNAANKNMADVVRGMNNVGAGMGGIAAASEKMAKAASDISRVMPDVTRQAEATAAAMERAASASQRLLTGPAPMLALPAPYASNGTGFTTQGSPYTPYGYTPNGRPISLLAPGSGVVPFNGGFTMGGGSGPQSTWTPPPGYTGPNAGSVVPSQSFGGAMPPLTPPVGPFQPGAGGKLFRGGIVYEMTVGIVRDLLGVLNAPFEHYEKLNTEQTQMRTAGVAGADIASLEELIWKIAAVVPTARVEKIAADSMTLRGILGEETGADKFAAIKTILPSVEKAAAVLRGATVEDSPEALARLYKTVELRGDVTDPQTHEISPERFAKGLDAALDILSLGKGIIKTNDLFNAAKQGGPALRSIEDPYAGWASVMTPLFELGGARTGTGLTAAFRALLGGSMARHFADEMKDLGFIKPGALYKQLMPAAGRNGAVVYDKDFLVDEDVLMKGGLQAWLADVAQKNLAARGITDAPSINKEFYRVANTETFRRIASIYLTQNAQVQRDMLLYKRMPNLDTKLGSLQDYGLAFNSDALDATFDNRLTSLGESFSSVKMGLMRAGNWIMGGPSGIKAGGLWSPDPRGWFGDPHPHSPWWAPGADQPEAYYNQHPSSAPVEDQRPVTMKGDVNLDGKKIGDFTARSIGAQGELPSAAPTGGDTRNVPAQPGMIWNLH